VAATVASTVFLLSVLATGSAWAYSLTISNGYYDDPVGVSAATHSLTMVDVQNNSGAGQGDACEDAINASGGWAQAYHYCAGPGNYTYHAFCGCQLRRGWNGPYTSAWMLGIEYY
jgi:hypothetical protein